MTKALKMVGLLLVVGMIAGSSWGALNDNSWDVLGLGLNITISDGDPTADGIGQGAEDNEVDYWATQGQAWDFEAFFLNGSQLSIVGGVDFVNGVVGKTGSIYPIGDLFISVADTAQIPAISPVGPGQVQGTFGYDYVFDMDWAKGTYDIYALNANSWLDTTSRANAQGSNPYKYIVGSDQALATGLSLAEYETGITALGVAHGLDNWGEPTVGHNAAVFNLSLGSMPTLGTGATFHITMLCGNDGANGRVPDGGVTLALLGMALIGLGGIARKKRN